LSFSVHSETPFPAPFSPTPPACSISLTLCARRPPYSFPPLQVRRLQ
jgi:hypothetical protein